MTRWGRRCKKLLDDLKDSRGYCQLKEEALDRTTWRNHFGRGFGPVVWQIAAAAAAAAADDDDDDDGVTQTGSEMKGPLKAAKVNAGTWTMFEDITSSDGMNQAVKW